MWLFFRISELHRGCDPEVGAKDVLELLLQNKMRFLRCYATGGLSAVCRFDGAGRQAIAQRAHDRVDVIETGVALAG